MFPTIPSIVIHVLLLSAMVPYGFKTWAWLLGLQSEPIIPKSPFYPSTIPGPWWNVICIGGKYLKQTFPTEYFQRGLDVLLERQQWLLQGFPVCPLELIYTHNNMDQKHGINWMCWFPYVYNTKGPSVCHIHDDPCIKLLSLQAVYSSVTLRLQQLLNFLLGRLVYCFPLLFHLQSCPWEGWVSKWWGGGGQRWLWQRDVYAGLSCCSSVSNGEQFISPAQWELHKASLCVWRERLSCAHIPTGSSCAIGRLWCTHSFLPPSLTQISCLSVMGLSSLGSALTQKAIGRPESLLLLLVLQHLQGIVHVMTEHWLQIWRNSSVVFISSQHGQENCFFWHPLGSKKGKKSGADTHFPRCTKKD